MELLLELLVAELLAIVVRLAWVRLLGWIREAGTRSRLVLRPAS